MSRREGGGGGEEIETVCLIALERKARRLLKRCRYEDAAKAFKQVATALQVQRDRGDYERSDGIACCGEKGDATREVGALEGLAICLSRQLE